MQTIAVNTVSVDAGQTWSALEPIGPTTWSYWRIKDAPDGTHYNAAYSGEVRIPLQTLPPLPLDERKVIARRAALELAPNSIINVGIGIPDCVARIAGEEKIQDHHR